MSCLVAPYSREDFDGLFEIERTSFDWFHRYSKKVLREDLEASTAYVGYSNHIPIGFVLGLNGHISRLAVASEFQGRRVGTTLLSTIEQAFYVAGHRQADLFVSNRNPAQILYFNRGYRTDSIKRDYFRKGEHVLVMVKPLKRSRNQ